MQNNKPTNHTTDHIMKLRNTTFTRTALILSAFGLLLNLPDIAHTIVNRDPDYLVTCVAFVFMAVATIFGMIQLALLRKQAQTLAKSVQPRGESLDLQRQGTERLRQEVRS
jgi:hypothetical protein